MSITPFGSSGGPRHTHPSEPMTSPRRDGEMLTILILVGIVLGVVVQYLLNPADHKAPGSHVLRLWSYDSAVASRIIIVLIALTFVTGFGRWIFDPRKTRDVLVKDHTAQTVTTYDENTGGV
jgi:hypothetical protein